MVAFSDEHPLILALRSSFRKLEGAYSPQELQYILNMAMNGGAAYKGLGATCPQHSRYLRIKELGQLERELEDQTSNWNNLSIGGVCSSNVIKSEIPFYIAGMSYGSLMAPMKIAIHLAANRLAKKHKISLIVNTGEGGALPWEMYGKEEHRANLSREQLQALYDLTSEILDYNKIAFGSPDEKREFIERELFQRHYSLIVQTASGRFWRDPNYINNADGIEIKIGQGAKIGHGGLLPGPKVDEYVARIRGIPKGKDARSPARILQILGPEDLVHYINDLREITRWEKPIIVKVGASRVYYDMRIILKSGADAAAVDGLTGGTGAAPVKVQNVIGINTEPAIVEGRKAIDDFFAEFGESNFKFLASGGIFDYEQIFKAIALGADYVGLGTAIMISGGDCALKMDCHTSKCPKKITGTSEKSNTPQFNIPQGVEQIVNFVVATTDRLRRMKHSRPTLADLITNNSFVSAFSGAVLESGETYERIVQKNVKVLGDERVM